MCKVPSRWLSRATMAHKQKQGDQMFLLKKGKELATWFISLCFHHRRWQDLMQAVMKSCSPAGTSTTWHAAWLPVLQSFNWCLCSTDTGAPQPSRNADRQPTSTLYFSAYLPLFWYLHFMPSLLQSTYIIFYCSAGKRFSIICNYFLIWPIWEVIAAEKNEQKHI